MILFDDATLPEQLYLHAYHSFILILDRRVER